MILLPTPLYCTPTFRMVGRGGALIQSSKAATLCVSCVIAVHTDRVFCCSGFGFDLEFARGFGGLLLCWSDLLHCAFCTCW